MLMKRLGPALISTFRSRLLKRVTEIFRKSHVVEHIFQLVGPLIATFGLELGNHGLFHVILQTVDNAEVADPNRTEPNQTEPNQNQTHWDQCGDYELTALIKHELPSVPKCT